MRYLKVLRHWSLKGKLSITQKLVSYWGIQGAMSMVRQVRYKMETVFISLCLLISLFWVEYARPIWFESGWQSTCFFNLLMCITRMLEIVLSSLHIVSTWVSEVRKWMRGVTMGPVQIGVPFVHTIKLILICYTKYHSPFVLWVRGLRLIIKFRMIVRLLFLIVFTEQFLFPLLRLLRFGILTIFTFVCIAMAWWVFVWLLSRLKLRLLLSSFFWPSLCWKILCLILTMQ